VDLKVNYVLFLLGDLEMIMSRFENKFYKSW